MTLPEAGTVRRANMNGQRQSTESDPGTFVRSLDRGLRVIRAFDGEHREMRLAEVAERTGLSRAAARRFLLTLVELGYIRLDRDRFSLQPRVLDLGYSYLSGLSFQEVAQPHMERLVQEVHESSSISVLDDLDVVYVVRVPTKRIMSITLTVGTRLPAYATSMGRVLLASLPPDQLESRLRRTKLQRLTPHTVRTKARLREVVERAHLDGYSMVDQELEQGLRSVAVPITEAPGKVAALNISVHASRTSMDALRKRFLPPLQETARAIERDARQTSPGDP